MDEIPKKCKEISTNLDGVQNRLVTLESAAGVSHLFQGGGEEELALYAGLMGKPPAMRYPPVIQDVAVATPS